MSQEMLNNLTFQLAPGPLADWQIKRGLCTLFLKHAKAVLKESGQTKKMTWMVFGACSVQLTTTIQKWI